MRAQHADVCVIGGGTLGALVSAALARNGRRVTVLEAGPGHAQRLLERVSQPEGVAHRGRTVARGFGLGGTSALWGGQLWSWARSEMAARPHLELPGWPVAYEDLLRGYAAAAQLLPLTDLQRRYLSSEPEYEETALGPSRNSTALPWRGRNFGRLLSGSAPWNSRVDILLDHEACAVQPAGRGGLIVAALDRDARSVVVQADQVVLAAGTIGNVEILSSSITSPHLGRGFMDHLTSAVAELEIVDRRRFQRLPPAWYRGRARFNRRILPVAGFAERHGLPWGLGHIELERPPEWSEVRSLLRRRQATHPTRTPRAELATMSRALPGLVRSAASLALLGQEHVGENWRLHLDIDIEQLPRPENRLTSGPGGTRMHWRHAPDDEEALTRYAEQLLNQADWARAGLAPVPVPERRITDAFHMMGGTRIGNSPEDGVVDARGNAFGLAGVRVVGASVFRSGGVANPTFTACALAMLAVEDMLGVTPCN